MNKLLGIAKQFAGGQSVSAINPLGHGLINDTFLVNTGATQFVLQGINSRVFAQPELVIANLQQLNRHIAQLDQENVRLRVPALLPAEDGQAFCRDQTGQIWRALELISPAESREQVSSDLEASQVGFALGHFHLLCDSLSPDALFDTLPGFHITPSYFQDYLEIIDRPIQVQADAGFQHCQQFIASFQDRISVLEQAKQRGELRERVIHGDPKLNNFLFEPGSDRIVSLIDLDTVKPGLVHYDIGDCLRSSCHIRQSNQFDVARCKIILTSYLAEAGRFFAPADYDHLYAAILLIPFELGLRFFCDYLQGNRYFKVNQPRENLNRAIEQFTLCKSIAQQEAELMQVIAQIA